jgi:hypothetical protein
MDILLLRAERIKAQKQPQARIRAFLNISCFFYYY